MRAFGGTKQIRTAVDGFADRCLTSRPWYHLRFAVQSYTFILNLANHFQQKLAIEALFCQNIQVDGNQVLV